MKLRTLIDVASLAELIRRNAVLVVDCRVDLADRALGPRVYAHEHVPGAVYANLETDLSDLSKPGLGRHPLPDAAAFSALLSRWGWTATTPVVTYDGANGALAAARLWWMLRLVGARDVAVLDGGWQAWQGAGLPVEAATPGLPVEAATPRRAPTQVTVAFDPAQIIDTDALRTMRQNILLLDARAAPRFRGEVEPIDPVAGHVPGARNRPFAENLTSAGLFKSAAELRSEFASLLGGHFPGDVVHMCGSGVTACHNLLATEHAGLAGSRVYAPSWSGYIVDHANPVATGND